MKRYSNCSSCRKWFLYHRTLVRRFPADATAACFLHLPTKYPIAAFFLYLPTKYETKENHDLS